MGTMYEVDQSTGAVGDPVLGDGPIIGGNVVMTKLWENPDPTQSFAAGSVELSSDDYDLLLTIYRWSITSDSNSSVVSVKGQGLVTNLTSSSSNGARIFERSATITDSTHIAFTDCIYTGGTTDNRNAIPYRIYGIKLKEV